MFKEVEHQLTVGVGESLKSPIFASGVQFQVGANYKPDILFLILNMIPKCKEYLTF